MHIKSADIKKVLAAIEKKSSYRFLYNQSLLESSPKVSVSAVDEEVLTVLNRLLENTSLAYEVVENNLVVLKQANSIFQDKRVKGRVTDESGVPVPGVAIRIKGTTNGTVTDGDGNFDLIVPEDAVLMLSSLGFASREIAVGEQTTIHVTLTASNTQLEQVVVVGYGTLRRSQVVGSVAKIDGKELARQPVLTAAQGLQGKASGIQVISSGAPGSQPQVRIRGTNTVSGDANPVYVVDGVITDNITGINNADIESIEVLKDAASQAIYGSRAANGVVLITTKKGRLGKMKIDFNSYVGLKSMTSKVKMADAQTYAQYTNEARGYDNQPPMFGLDTLQYNTDWFDEATRNGMIQNYSLSLSGGTEKTSYYFSTGYFNDEGIVRNENFERVNFRLNNSYKIAPFLEFGHNINFSITRSNDKPNPFNDAYRNAPTTPVRFPDGDYGLLVGLSVGNPVKANELVDNTNKGTRLQGDVYTIIRPVEHLSLRSSFSFNRNNYDILNYSYAYTPVHTNDDRLSSLSVENGNSFYYNLDNNATYNRTFSNIHEVIATAGYSAERTKGFQLRATGDNVPAASNLWYLAYADPGSLEIPVNRGSLVNRASLYGRLTYTFDKRYNFSGVLRRDGSSNFPANNKWGTFYSAGASWVISQERFMADQRIFDELRLRVGYGKLGNDRVPGGSLSNVNPVSQAGNYWFGGGGYDIVPGITINQLRDAQVSWEETKGVDAGLEFSVLRRRLSVEATYYNKVSNVYIPVTLVALAGDNDNSVYSRAADVSNKGVELNLNWKDKVNGHFSYFAGFNITFNRNNVENVKGALQLRGGSLSNGEIVTYTVPGREIGSFWVYEVAGIFKTQEEVDATAAKITGSKPGDFIYTDVNKDGMITDLDRVFVGSYQPKTYFGLNAGFTWKNLDLSIDCYGNYGNKIYNGKKAVRIGNDNIELARAEGRWTPDNINATVPRASNTIPKPSTYYVESGDFFRINNITTGYNIPSRNWNIGITSLRIFASTQNPVIFKQFSGFTPELPGLSGSNNGIHSGIELGIYPVSTTYMFGINASF
ncbi:TonB-dependent receptor [Chitinophaga sp. XS-30]|nr:TonB-dependent receptor [Chitinophaga sp. XS-30]